jgi:hypothetical protein
MMGANTLQLGCPSRSLLVSAAQPLNEIASQHL